MKKKVAIVTGGSKGLGAAICKKFSKNQISLSIIFKNDIEAANRVAKQCRENGVEAIAIKADVSDSLQCRSAVEKTVKKLGNINILINNAGMTKFVDFKDLFGLSENDFLDIYKTNVVSAFMMIRESVDSLRKTKEPKIVNISSVASMGLGSSIAYATSKGALNTLGVALARTLSPEIVVNTICPGYIKTTWWGGDDEIERKAKEYEKAVPLQRSASPEEIAETVFWFVNTPHLITGETLLVDGGYHLKA